MTSGDWRSVGALACGLLLLVALFHLALYESAVSHHPASVPPPPPPLHHGTPPPPSVPPPPPNSIRIHFPRTSRRLPQAIIIGVRKCGTRALLEMLYLCTFNNYPYKAPPLARSSAFSLPLIPHAIIIGVRKCGTRALLEMLYLHPGIQKAAGEVHFFDRDDNYNKGLDWYRKKMPHSFKGQITIEKSPSYFVTPEVPERIRAMNASVKLLLIVREPVTRAISDYTQLRSHAASSSSPPLPSSTTGSWTGSSGGWTGSSSGWTGSSSGWTGSSGGPPPRSFEQLAIRSDGSVNSAYRPLALSIYHTFMHRWLEVFPRQQLLVVNGDRLIEDPVSELERVESFLGLEHRIGRHNFYFNRTKGFYCLRNDTQDKCLRDSKGRKHPRVDPKVLGKLRRFYVEHNQKFYELVGEDLGWPEK